MQNKTDKGTLLVSKSLPVVNSNSVNHLFSARKKKYYISSNGTSVWECSASESSCCSSFCRCEAPSAYRNWSAHIRPDQYVCSTFLSSLSDLPEWVPALWNSLIWECLSPVQYVLCRCRLCISSVWFCK